MLCQWEKTSYDIACFDIILTECLPYIFVLSESVLRQSELDYLVLCVCEAVARVNQFLKLFGKVD